MSTFSSSGKERGTGCLLEGTVTGPFVMLMLKDKRESYYGTDFFSNRQEKYGGFTWETLREDAD